MLDRSSRPRMIPAQTTEAAAERITRHRRQRLGVRLIAELTGVSPAARATGAETGGMLRLKDLTPAEPVARYACQEPEGLIHLCIKKTWRLERVGYRITPCRQLRAIACRALDHGSCHKSLAFTARPASVPKDRFGDIHLWRWRRQGRKVRWA
jgi:hypothetical protein